MFFTKISSCVLVSLNCCIDNTSFCFFFLQKFDPSKDFVNASDHGYDNDNMEMKAIFYARGPAFKPSYRAKPLKSVGTLKFIENYSLLMLLCLLILILQKNKMF